MKFASFLLVALAVAPSAAIRVGNEKEDESLIENVARESAKSGAFEEDDNHWSRFLQDSDMSVAPSPTPRPPTPSEPACQVDAEVTCTSGEGIECGLIEAVDPETEPENCLSSVTYSYKVVNTGPNIMAITSADVQFKDETAEDILPLFKNTILAPEGSDVVRQDRTVDLCAAEDCATTFEVNAAAENGKECQDTDVYILSPPAPFRDDAPPPTPPMVAPPPTLAPITTEVGGPIVTACNDVRNCFDGALCVASDVEPGSYLCDCDESPIDGPSPFVGLDCRYYEATDICIGLDLLRTHFCANGGTCPEDDGWPFAGCSCEGYDGAHCQFYVGPPPPTPVPTSTPTVGDVVIPALEPNNTIVSGQSDNVIEVDDDNKPILESGSNETVADAETVTDAICQVLSCTSLCVADQETYIELCSCVCTGGGRGGR